MLKQSTQLHHQHLHLLAWHSMCLDVDYFGFVWYCPVQFAYCLSWAIDGSCQRSDQPFQILYEEANGRKGESKRHWSVPLYFMDLCLADIVEVKVMSLTFVTWKSVMARGQVLTYFSRKLTDLVI